MDKTTSTRGKGLFRKNYSKSFEKRKTVVESKTQKFLEKWLQFEANRQNSILRRTFYTVKLGMYNVTNVKDVFQIIFTRQYSQKTPTTSFTKV